ncbi:hypothetical protein BGZ82_002239 [Podila clonocystis]|nr:hypothetical protein BGZ82_002239 [Podila clonocystis]
MENIIPMATTTTKILCVDPLPIIPIKIEETCFDALNNGRPKPPKPTHIRYVVMSTPCSKDLPANCTTAKAMAGEPSDVEGDNLKDSTSNAHHNKYGYHKHKHNHRKCNKKCKGDKDRRKHAYKDLCMATGDFCSNKLYSCDFDAATLYTCTAVGEKPIIKKTNAPFCTSKANGSEEACNCTSATPICGSSLGADRKAEPNAIYYCLGGIGTPLVLLKICIPGTQCHAGCKGGDPICGFDTCDCKGEKQGCSEQSPEKCGLELNMIYKCSVTGRPIKVQTCPNDKLCVTLATGAICSKGDCTCNGDGTVCGESFPLQCRINATRLYTCSKNGKPVFAKDCYPSHCVATAAIVFGTSYDQCMDGCECPSKGKICGQTFMKSCGLKIGSLYSCDAASAKPVEVEIDSLVCRSSLHKECNALDNAIYSCNGLDSDPEWLTKCRPGTQCQVGPNGAVCGYDNCKCIGTVEVCSDLFPDRCGLTPNSIYKCSSSGKLELVSTCDADKACVTVSDGSVCIGKDCRCHGDGLTCGKAFPLICRIPATSLYKCTKGDDPIEDKSCLPGHCTASDATVCGSTFPPACGLDANTLHKCAGKRTKPYDGAKCKGKCIAQVGNNTCLPPAEDCSCPTKTAAPICGSELPLSCNADLNTIYICCNGKGSKPESLAICKPGTICIKKPLPTGATCGSGTCECKGNNEVCMDAFPDKCKLQSNSVYKCTAGGTPELVKSCSEKQTCITISDGSICTRTDCNCSEDGTSCGKIFPLSCSLKQTALYTCQKNQSPVFQKDCYSDRCKATKASAAATSTFNDFFVTYTCSSICSCTQPGLVCGRTFSAQCMLSTSSLYKCDAIDGTPILSEECKAGGCTVTNGDNHCHEDTCTCPCSGTAPVCGSELPASCNANANYIYYCPGGSGAKPEVLSICKPGIVCIKKPLPRGATCGSGNCECSGNNEVCSSSFPDKYNLKPSSVYKCTSGGKPELVKTCADPQACVTVSDGSICASKDCKCSEDGVSCGEIFPLSCLLKQAALYICKASQGPVFKEECPDGCSTKKSTVAAMAMFQALANDQCNKECTCTKPGLVCGKTFPPKCKLEPSTLYKCDGFDGTPTVTEKCGEGGCTVTNGNGNKPEILQICKPGTMEAL